MSEPTTDRVDTKAAASPASTRRQRRSRGAVAWMLVVLACISLFASTIGVWSRRSFLDTAVWQRRVVPLPEQPAVQKALVVVLTNQVMTLVQPQPLFERALPAKADVLAAPLSGVVRQFVYTKVTEFVGSEPFRRLWARAAVQAHTDAVRLLRNEATGLQVVRGRIALNVLPILNRLLVGVADDLPGVLGEKASVPALSANDLPDEARSKLAKALGRPVSEDFGVVTVYDGRSLKAVQDGVALFDRLVVGLVVLTLLLVAAAIGVSSRRRRTGLHVVVGLGIVFVLVRQVVKVATTQALSQIHRPVPHDAAAVVLDAFFRPLTRAAGLGAGGLLLVGLVLVLTGPYPFAVRLRAAVAASAGRAADAASGPAAGTAIPTWLTDHVAGLRVAGWIVAVAGLWLFTLSWLGLAVFAVLVATYQIALARLAGPTDDVAPDLA